MDGNNSSQNSPYPQGAGQNNPNPVNPPPVVPTPPPFSPNPTTQTAAPMPPPVASPPPVPSTPSSYTPPAPPPEEKHSKINKKVLAVVALLVIGVSLPLTVFMSRQQQNLEQEASKAPINDSTILFEINGESFSLADVKEVALEQYPESEVGNKDVQKIAKDILIEREILDSTGLSVSDDEVSALMETSGMSQKEAYYELLRAKVTGENVRHIKAISIGYWVPPPELAREDTTSQEQTEITEQVSIGDSAIGRIEDSLGSVQNPLTLARSIASNNPELADVLAVNGYKLSSITAEDEDLISEPEVYEYNDSNFDEETRNTLFAQNVSENSVIRVGKNDSNGGETVYKVVEINNSGAGSYEDWLKSEREKQVSGEIPL